MQTNIILFGGGLQVLSLARGLKNPDTRIINIGDKHSVGRYSHFIDKFYKIELNEIDVHIFIKFLSSIHADVIIPTEDEYAEWLSENKIVIEKHTGAKCAIVNPDLLKTVITKSSLLEICKANGIPHPKNAKLNFDNVNTVASYVGFPSLIKPDISNGSRGISKVNNIIELQSKLRETISKYGDCSLQEFIYNPNHYYNCMLYRYSDGTYAIPVVTKIIRFYPIKGGSSSFCTSIENKKIVEICSNLLEILNWTGFADFDILEKGDGDYRIIEINPRVPASVHAALISGVDYGKIMVEDLLNLPRTSMKYHPGKHLRFLGLDIAWFLSSPHRFNCKPSWFKFFEKNIYYQEGGFRDAIAMIYSIWSGLKKQLSPKFREAKSGMN